MDKCQYGCGKIANFTMSNGKKCCCDNHNKCPGLRSKNSMGVKKAHEDGKCHHHGFTFENRGWNRGKNILTDERVCHKHTIDKIFIENSTVARGYVKKLLQSKSNYIHKCNMCGTEEWLGKPVALELDHINGIHNDNRIENLRFICPNCHATTHTWKGRNIQKSKKVTDGEIVDAIKTCPNIRQVLIKVGLTAMGKNYDRVNSLRCENNLKWGCGGTADTVDSEEKGISSSTLDSSTKNQPSEMMWEFKSPHPHQYFCKSCGKECKNNPKCGLCNKCRYADMPKKFVVDKETLEKDVMSMSLVKVGKKYGVSDNAIRKRCNKLGIPFRKETI